MAERPPRLEAKVGISNRRRFQQRGNRQRQSSLHLIRQGGAKVLLVDFQDDRARGTLQMTQEEGGVASTLQGDMTKIVDCQRMADTAMER